VTGVAIVLISGEIDLSVGYNVLFSNIVFGTLAVLRVPVWLAIVLTVMLSSAMGLLVGVLVTRARVNSFIATLAAGLIFYGSGLFIYLLALPLDINGQSTMYLSHETTLFAQYQLVPGLNFQIPIIYALIICCIFLLTISKTKFFAQYYFVGANYEAAMLSGINSKRLKTIAFIISFGLAAFGGVIMCGRMGMTGSTIAIGWEAQIITGAVIGGVSLRGGKGTILGAYAGMLLIICLNNAMRIASVPSNIYKIVYGAVLLGAVAMDTLLGKRKMVG